MIASLIKRENGREYTENMKNKYKNIKNLEEIVNNSNNMKFVLELDNWRYYNKNPNEIIEEEYPFFSDEYMLTKLDYEIIQCIRNQKPGNVDELAEVMGKTVSTIRIHLKKLEK